MFTRRHRVSRALAVVTLVAATALYTAAAAAAAAAAIGDDAQQCFLFPGATYGQGELKTLKVDDAAACCDACGDNGQCAAWTFHKRPVDVRYNCYLKGNVKTEQPPRPVDPNNMTLTGLRPGRTCQAGDLCPEGWPCPSCGQATCSCAGPNPGHRGHPMACVAPHDKFPFCNTSLSVADRVRDLVSRINDTVKANLLTARGRGGSGQNMQALPELGVPSYYWGTNCLHSLNGGACVLNVS